MIAIGSGISTNINKYSFLGGYLKFFCLPLVIFDFQLFFYASHIINCSQPWAHTRTQRIFLAAAQSVCVVLYFTTTTRACLCAIMDHGACVIWCKMQNVRPAVHSSFRTTNKCNFDNMILKII